MIAMKISMCVCVDSNRILANFNSKFRFDERERESRRERAIAIMRLSVCKRAIEFIATGKSAEDKFGCEQ